MGVKRYLLDTGIMGLKAGPMAPVISLAKHFAFGLVVAWLYPVTARTSGAKGSAPLTMAQSRTS